MISSLKFEEHCWWRQIVGYVMNLVYYTSLQGGWGQYS